MALILTLDYEYIPAEQPWFTKMFSNYTELFKWLREDSIIILPKALLADIKLKEKLFLTKLALPKAKIIVVSNDQSELNDSFFSYSTEENLEKVIQKAIVNQHQFIDNRDNLKKTLDYYS